jgi:hypothetical protein
MRIEFGTGDTAGPPQAQIGHRPHRRVQEDAAENGASGTLGGPIWVTVLRVQIAPVEGG